MALKRVDLFYLSVPSITTTNLCTSPLSNQADMHWKKNKKSWTKIISQVKVSRNRTWKSNTTPTFKLFQNVFKIIFKCGIFGHKHSKAVLLFSCKALRFINAALVQNAVQHRMIQHFATTETHISCKWLKFIQTLAQALFLSPRCPPLKVRDLHIALGGTVAYLLML